MVEVPNIVKAVADNDELKSKISKIIDDPNVNATNNVGVQRHLHSKNKVNLNSQMGDSNLRGNLSKKFKPSKSKLQQGTPEKSEIAKMFEKIRLKKEQKMIQDSQDIRQNNLISQRFDILPDDSAKNNGQNSPILTQKIRSKQKFAALRSIFEAGGSDGVRLKMDRCTDEIEVKNYNNISTPKKSPNRSGFGDFGDKVGDDFELKSIQKRSSNPSKTPIKLSVISTQKCIVGLQNPKKMSCPNADKKQKKTSSGRKIRRKKEEKDEQSSLTPITRYLERKNWLQR